MQVGRVFFSRFHTLKSDPIGPVTSTLNWLGPAFRRLDDKMRLFPLEVRGVVLPFR